MRTPTAELRQTDEGMRRDRWRPRHAAMPRWTRGSQQVPKRTSPPLFYRQVIASSARSSGRRGTSSITYTAVSLVFVVILIGIVFGLDAGFGWVTLKLFG